LVLELILLVRGKEGNFLSLFPSFYCYIAYIFSGSAVTLVIYRLYPEHYASAFWFHFLITLLAEFAVLVEISDRVFDLFPALRRLGRFLTLSICATFFLLYIFPALTERRSASAAILDLMKRTSVTKTAIIIVLLAVARYYRVPLGRNISGMMLGFSLYLAVNVANFAVAETYGRALYARAFAIVGPLSYAVCLLVWTLSLWRYEPVLQTDREVPETAEKVSEPLAVQLGRLDTALTRLFRR
jgi:hypothetical protein